MKVIVRGATCATIIFPPSELTFERLCILQKKTNALSWFYLHFWAFLHSQVKVCNAPCFLTKRHVEIAHFAGHLLNIHFESDLPRRFDQSIPRCSTMIVIRILSGQNIPTIRHEPLICVPAAKSNKAICLTSTVYSSVCSDAFACSIGTDGSHHSADFSLKMPSGSRARAVKWKKLNHCGKFRDWILK